MQPEVISHQCTLSNASWSFFFFFYCWRSPSNWNSVPSISCLWWWLCCCEHCMLLYIATQWTVKNWFVWPRMKWIICDSSQWVSHEKIWWTVKTIGRSLKEKLLSCLAFHRNVWVTLLMFFNIGSFDQDRFFTAKMIASSRVQMYKKEMLEKHIIVKSHTSHATQETSVKLDFMVLSHPPYTPNLALCVFYFFPNLKNCLHGHLCD